MMQREGGAGTRGKKWRLYGGRGTRLRGVVLVFKKGGGGGGEGGSRGDRARDAGRGGGACSLPVGGMAGVGGGSVERQQGRGAS